MYKLVHSVLVWSSWKIPNKSDIHTSNTYQQRVDIQHWSSETRIFQMGSPATKMGIPTYQPIIKLPKMKENGPVRGKRVPALPFRSANALDNEILHPCRKLELHVNGCYPSDLQWMTTHSVVKLLQKLGGKITWSDLFVIQMTHRCVSLDLDHLGAMGSSTMIHLVMLCLHY